MSGSDPADPSGSPSASSPGGAPLERSADPAQRRARTSSSVLTPELRALIVAQLGFGYAFSSFFLLPTFLERELGATATQVGWVVSAGAAPVIALLPLIGRATDRFGRRRFLTLGGAIMTVACSGFLFVDELGPLIFVLRLVQALAFSMNFAAGGALAVDLAPPGRTSQAVGLFGLAFLAMNGVASAIVERLAQSYGWDAAFGAAAACALLCTVLSRYVREPAGVGTAAAPAPPAAADRAVRLRAMAVMASVGVALGAMFSFAQLYGARLGISDVSTFFVAYAVAGVIVRAGFGHLLDQWGPANVCRYALGAYAAVVASTIWIDTLTLIAVGGALGLVHGVFYPSYTAVVLSQATARLRSRVIAYLQAAFNTGALSSAALGLVADHFGYPLVFAIAASTVATAWALHLTDRAVRGGAANPGAAIAPIAAPAPAAIRADAEA